MSKNATITEGDKLIALVMHDYTQNDTELSECFFEGISINMNKGDLLDAYAEIQHICNGDTVVRLEELPFKTEGLTDEECDRIKICENLIPAEWENMTVTGDAMEILKDINRERLTGGPIFARLDDNAILDLLYGDFRENDPT